MIKEKNSNNNKNIHTVNGVYLNKSIKNFIKRASAAKKFLNINNKSSSSN